jgi:hypothetical protein
MKRYRGEPSGISNVKTNPKDPVVECHAALLIAAVRTRSKGDHVPYVTDTPSARSCYGDTPVRDALLPELP